MSEPSSSSSSSKKIIAALVVLAIGFLIGRYSVAEGTGKTYAFPWRSSASSTSVSGVGQAMPANLASSDVEFRRFWELWRLLKDKYYRQPVSEQELFYGAMGGLAGGLKDPYTSYFPPTDAKEFEASLQGEFEGIGAEIGIKDEQLQIIAPLADTPAERAGLLAGDAILKIDDQDTTGMSVEQAVKLIRGQRGTKVTLSVFRASQRKGPFDVSIQRDIIQIKSVKWSMAPGKKRIAIIELSTFGQDTTVEFRDAIREILEKDPEGLILDLRNNPGGYLDGAVDVASEWLGKEVVVKERRQGKIIEEMRGEALPRLNQLPTIVLVNQGSASASEIVAGALQDLGLARLVGMKTFGKGSVQEYEPLSDGSAVKITVAEWLTPHDRTIQSVGLEPDVSVDRTPEDYEAKRDPQLERALELLTNPQNSTSCTGGCMATTTVRAPATSTRPGN
jgi:carboxyl-terminal processing protease